MILRAIVGLSLLPVLAVLYVVGATASLLWIGLAAGWHSAMDILDWIRGDTYAWKVKITRVPKEPPHDP